MNRLTEDAIELLQQIRLDVYEHSIDRMPDEHFLRYMESNMEDILVFFKRYKIRVKEELQ